MASAGTLDAVVLIEELLDFFDSVRGSRNTFEEEDFPDHMEEVSLSFTVDERRPVAFRKSSDTPNDMEFLECTDVGRSTWKLERGREVAGELGEDFCGLGLTAGTIASS